MKTLTRRFIVLAAVLTGWLVQSPCSAQYNQALTSVFTSGANAGADKNATTAPNDFVTFSNAVAAAHTSGFGGVFDFPTTVANNTTIFRGTYADGTKRLQFTSSVNMQNATGSGTFTPTSPGNLITSAANQSAYNLRIGPIVDPATDLPLSEGVASIGFMVLPRGNAIYPLDIRATVSFSDGSTEAVTANISNVRTADETFYGFTAPGDLTITNVLLQSFSPGTETLVADRIGLDDIGFITKTLDIVQPPAITGINPASFVIHEAANGVQFQVLSSVPLNDADISLVLNSTDVSSQLVFSGETTNRSASFSGLLPDLTYVMTISATNEGGASSVTRTFYTHASSFALYDSEGFTDDTLYPLGALQPVTHGGGTWAPNADEPAQIVDAGAPQDKVFERMGTGLSRSDTLHLPPLASGTLIVEFDVWVSTTAARTIDIALMPFGTTGTTMASLLAWGEVPGKLAYFDNSNWIPVADLQSGWQRCKVIHYLSGPSAGRLDIIVNDLVVAQRVLWRHPAAVGLAFSRLRIQTQNTAALFEVGRLDNLIVTADLEDTNASPPPMIVPINPATGQSIVRTADGFQFGVNSYSPITAADIGVVLNGQDVSGALQVGGSETNAIVSYTALQAETNYTAEITATNSGGNVTVTLNFISTEQPWLYHPSPGWAGPWQHSSGSPQLLSADAAQLGGSYLHLDTSGDYRNFMRQYESVGPIDITQPHFIRWKFRVTDPEFDINFDAFEDRVHFFARNAPRLGGGTDAAMSWAIYAHGAAQGDGAVAGQTFYIYDNILGDGAFSVGNEVNTGILMRPDHVYSFEVLVNPADRTYSVVLKDETIDSTFTSAAPHKFRAAAELDSHTMVHFGLRVNPGTLSREFDLGPVSITAAVAPRATLVNPVVNDNVFSFSFQSYEGISYTAQHNNNVGSTSWTDLVTIAGDGSVKTVNHTNPPPGQLFYRVLSVMP